MLRRLIRIFEAKTPALAQTDLGAGAPMPPRRPSRLDDGQRDASALAQEVLATSPVIFDTETTGLGGNDQIIEISCVSATGEVLLDSLVRPSCPVSAGARWVHGISDADLADAPSITELMPRLHEVFDDRNALAYNFDFDRRFLAQTLAAAGIEWPAAWQHWQEPAARYCIMRLYARFFGAQDAHRGGGQWQKLGNALSQCGLETDASLHHALADARAALMVLEHMASQRR